jgi:hypothetical protein
MEVAVAVRVLRLMEYTYPDLETAHADMSRWFVQGTWKPNDKSAVEIRSSVILNPTPVEVPLPEVKPSLPEGMFD